MRSEYSDCHRQYYDSDLNDGDICGYLHHTIDVCGEKWNRCHSPEEIFDMKKQHISAFLQRRQPGDNTILRCPTFIKFRGSEEPEVSDPEPTKRCTDHESTAATNRFQTCSRNIATSVYSSISELTARQQIVRSLCAALDRINALCPLQLEECFAQEDARVMSGLHARETKKFFIRLVEDRLPADALDDCDAQDEVVEENGAAENDMKKEVTIVDKKPPRDIAKELSVQIDEADQTVEHKEEKVPDTIDTGKDTAENGWFVEDKGPDITGPYSNPGQPRNTKAPKAYSVKGSGARSALSGFGAFFILVNALML